MQESPRIQERIDSPDITKGPNSSRGFSNHLVSKSNGGVNVFKYQTLLTNPTPAKRLSNENKSEFLDRS